MSSRWMLPALLATLLLAGAASPEGAQRAAGERSPQQWAYELSNELMSPYCPGRTLADCPSPQAETLRMWIIVQEAAGRSRDEVREEIVERFGDQVLPAPRAEGFGITAYAIPILAFLVGGVLVAFVIRRMTRGREAEPTPAGPAAPLDPELERLVDRDLAG